MLRISWVAAQVAASQEGLSSMSEWVSYSVIEDMNWIEPHTMATFIISSILPEKIISRQPCHQNLLRRLFSLNTWSVEHYSSPFFANNVVVSYWMSPISFVFPNHGFTSYTLPTVSCISELQNPSQKLINPENNHFNACRNIGKPPTSYAAYFRKRSHAKVIKSISQFRSLSTCRPHLALKKD
jgi:hypothetical protein